MVKLNGGKGSGCVVILWKSEDFGFGFVQVNAKRGGGKVWFVRLKMGRSSPGRNVITSLK